MSEAGVLVESRLKYDTVALVILNKASAELFVTQRADACTVCCDMYCNDHCNANANWVRAKSVRLDCKICAEVC